MRCVIRSFAAGLLFGVAPAVLAGQGVIVPRGCVVPLRAPEPVCPRWQSMIQRTRSDVRVELVGRVLRYEVEERFVNRGGGLGEADYLFPLPKDAAFRDLQLSINGELVSGETMNASDARRIYEEIVRRQRDPALVEWMGSGLLRARIFPIAPGEEKRVVVRFESVAEREGDAWIVRGRLEGKGEGSGNTSGRARDGSTFALTYTPSNSLGTPYSPTHELDIAEEGNKRVARVRGDARDVTILVPVRRPDTPAISVLTNAPGNEDGFALLTVTPPADSRRRTTPRDVTFVLDVSGSMAGRKMEQARAAGRQLLATLRSQDRFRMIDFSTDVRSFRGDFVYATEANVAAATRYLNALEAGGATNIDAALKAALAGEGTGGTGATRLPIVLFITDGEPTVGVRDPAVLASEAHREGGGGGARLFTFGLGSDVNAALLEQLALQGGGTAQFVRPEENVERAVGIVASRLVDPVLTDVRVRTDGDVRLSKMLPSTPADLFAGQDLVLVARYSGHGSARVIVEGRRDGETVRWTSEAVFPERDRDNPFVARLWATQRVGWLSAEKRRPGGSGPVDTREIDDEIRALGERFGIPTEFSSYLVQEPCAGAGRIGGCVANVLRPIPPGVHAVTIGGAAAPRAELAFAQAKQAAEQRDAQSLAAVDAAAPMAAGANRATTRVDGRSFVRRNGRWVDVRWRDGIRVVKLESYSPAYFELLERLPELRSAFALGERVLVVGRTLAIESTPPGAGAPSIDARELEHIIRDW